MMPDDNDAGRVSLFWRIAITIAKRVMPFCTGMVLMTILCVLVWEGFVDGEVYYANPLANHFESGVDYLHPGRWIGQGGQPVAVVAHVVDGASEKDPDQLKQGWSVPILSVLWAPGAVV
jgi:hypothetical protein